MQGHRIEMEVGDECFETLADILPDTGPIRMLIVGKVPMPDSVRAGHYFQGHHGQSLWGLMRKYGLLVCPPGDYEDDHLLGHNYGITDVAKRPRKTGKQPTPAEYSAGRTRILELVRRLQPAVAFFVYKKALDELFGEEGDYGFRGSLDGSLGCKVFACPLPGVGGQSVESIEHHWQELKRFLDGI